MGFRIPPVIKRAELEEAVKDLGISAVVYTEPGEATPDPSLYPEGTLWIEVVAT